MENAENTNNIPAAIEAILFIYGEPIEIKRLVKILQKRGLNADSRELNADTNLIGDKTEIKESDIKKALEELQQSYQIEDRGLYLIFSDDRVQLATKPKFTLFLENFMKEEIKENLTPAALETLSLIAYLGPLSRAEIDYYRGVNSSFILRNLLIRGLIERFSNPQKPNLYLYQVSFNLLRYLGLSKIEDLPEYEKYHNVNIQTNTNDINNTN
jgi:segregation and condensation protein B